MWLANYKSLKRECVIRACQLHLLDIPKMSVVSMLEEFFAKVQLAKRKFGALLVINAIRVEYLAEQVLCMLKQTIGDLHDSALDPPPYTAIRLCGGYDASRHICERLFTFLTGIQTEV
jgi:hypothetical protein